MRDLALPAEAAGEVLPAPVLAQARDLVRRFPQAQLQPALLVRAAFLDATANPAGGCRVWLCLENMQTTGSFKVRGALTALAHAKQRGVTRVVAASAGNHGAGVARAARVLGLEAMIAVPESTPERKLSAMRSGRVQIERVAGGYDHAEAFALNWAAGHGVPFVSPYDDDWVASGNGGSVGFEMVAALGRVPERVVAPIGGGGLATGLACALAREAGEDPGLSRRVWTVQSECSPAFARSVETGRTVTTLEPAGPTLAEGLEGGISERGFARSSRVVAGVTVVTEARIASAMRFLWQNLGLRVEGSGAAALVPVLHGAKPLRTEGDLVVVLTGRNVDEEVFRRVVDSAGPC